MVVQFNNQSRPAPELERFYLALLDWAGVERPVRVTPRGVEARVLESGSERLVFVLNHAKAAVEAEVAVQAPAGLNAATELTGDRAVPVTRAGGEAGFRVALEPEGVRVVRLRRGSGY